VIGGFGRYTTQASPRSDAYDPATGSWKRIADMPVNVTHSPAVLVGDVIWVLGGFVGNHPGPSTKDVWRYDISSNAWSRGPSLPAPRGAGAAAVVNGKIHFFGGGDRRPGTTNFPDEAEHWALDLANQSAGWKPRADLPGARDHLAGAALGGTVYAIGGQIGGESSGNQRRVDRYNPTTNSWSRAADMPTARGHITASAFVVNGKLIVGGGTNNGNVPSKDMASYDPSSNSWTVLPPLPSGRKTPVMGLIGGRLVSSTGYNGTGTRTTWVSTPLSGSPPPPPPDPAPTTGAYLQQNGTVVIEAEHRDSAVGRSSKAWQPTQPSGAVGGAMAVLPDTGSLFSAGTAASQAPELRFRVKFAQAGTYRVSLRVLAPNGNGDSAHVGLDGTISASSDNISGASFGSWSWAVASMDGPSVATINVPTAGEHIVNVFAREDGLVLDRLVIAPTSASTPSGTGPPESSRG